VRAFQTILNETSSWGGVLDKLHAAAQVRLDVERRILRWAVLASLR